MRILSVTAFVILLAAPVRAQETVVLPDLAPRVVEITGDLTISFPSLDRQPLVGFNPPPRIPEIPASRQPFTETYKQAQRDLPQNPLRAPEAPAMSSLSGRTPARGLAEAGVGRYLERYVKAHLSAPIGETATFYLAGHYHGNDGQEPFSEYPDINTSWQDEFLSAGIQNESKRLQYGGGGGLERLSYSLFGAVPVAVSPAQLDPSREVSNWNATVWMQSVPGSSVTGHVSLFAEHTSVKTDLFNPVVRSNPTAERGEDRLVADASIGLPVSNVRVGLDGHISFRGLDTKNFPGRTVPSGSAAGHLSFQANELVAIDAGLRLIGFNALGQADNGADRKLIYLSPEFNVSYVPSPGMEVTFSNTPEVSRESTFDLYYLSPYIEDKPAIQPVLTPIDVRAGVRTQNEVFKAQAGLGWKNVKNYRFIENATVPVNGIGEGFLSVNYDEARILYVDALVGAALAPGIQASVDVAFRRGHLKGSDSIIPYFSPMTSTASLLANLLSNRIQFKLEAIGESSRYTNREETSKVGSLLLFDIESTYFVTSRAGIVLGVRSLGSRNEFWENYERESSVFYAGAKWRW